MSRDEARENRLEALAQMRDAGRPVKIHHSTGRSLARDGFAVKGAGGLWAITEAGVAEINREEREERRARIDWNVNEAQRKYAQRVIAWLEVHGDLSISGLHYARHVANALLSGRVPIESGMRWEEEGDARIRAWVEAAIDALEEMREAKQRTRADGGDIVVSYNPSVSVISQSRQRRVVAVAESSEPEGDNVIGLERYRQERLA